MGLSLPRIFKNQTINIRLRTVRPRIPRFKTYGLAFEKIKESNVKFQPEIAARSIGLN